MKLKDNDMPQLVFYFVNYDQQKSGSLHEVSINVSLAHNLCVDVTFYSVSNFVQCYKFCVSDPGILASSKGIYVCVHVQKIGHTCTKNRETSEFFTATYQDFF